MVGWACEKVISSPVEEDVSGQIFRMLQDSPGISYARIASAAYKVNKKDLATNVSFYLG